MNFANDGLTLWYGTPDAPAPGDSGVVPRKGATLVVGVQPASPMNTVLVTYRVDGGVPGSVPGRSLRVDHARQCQYFAVTFPDFPSGDEVAYSVVASCAGRQVPAAHVAARFPSRFSLVARPGAAPRAAAGPPSTPRFSTGLEFIATVSVQFEEPQFVTDTADGMRVNFFVREGSITGDGLSGRVLPRGSDHLLIRPDGMGVVQIDAAFALADGAVLDVRSGGYVDFGPDGYRSARAQRLPDRSPLVITPLIATRHPRYRRLSRLQCLGIGETHLDAGQATYHVYAVSAAPLA